MIFPLHDHVRLSETLLDIPDVDAYLGSQIAGGITFGEGDIFGLVVDDNRAFFHRLGGIKDRWQLFVFNLD